ncbi:MAG: Fe-S cluster assembly protein HesB, partial [Actinomycetota bacterium]|nr:Fe-S cluster assembly protein HesB [Actinomycetota bacterium]
MPSSLRFTGHQDADDLLNDNPLALLMGMLLDQQFPIERAFL